MISRAGASTPRSAPSNLRLRVVSGLLLIAVAVAVTWLGGTPFTLFAAAIGAAVFVEWATITRARAAPAHQAIAALLLAAILVAVLLDAATGAWIFGALAICLISGLAFGGGLWTTAGFAYALAAAVPLALLRSDTSDGLRAMSVLFAVVWATDILAYFVGRALRGPKLAPAISPGKTWSGAVGGTIGGVGAGLLAAGLANVPIGAGLVGLVALLSVVSQIGDLFESWVKRRFGAKDSGAIIPGHGGVMDRVDGLVAAGLVLYLVQAATGDLLMAAGRQP